MPILRMKRAIISSIIPIKMNAAAMIHGRIRGSMTTRTPRTMSNRPGMIRVKPEKGISIIPLQTSAIGHVGNGVVCSGIEISTVRIE